MPTVLIQEMMVETKVQMLDMVGVMLWLKRRKWALVGVRVWVPRLQASGGTGWTLMAPSSSL
jgi:hypothetical protein